jgi:hypothetical protein
MEQLPAVVDPPQIRNEFLTFAQARKILAQHTKWSAMLRGDLHVHTLWSDGSCSKRNISFLNIHPYKREIRTTQFSSRCRV